MTGTPIRFKSARGAMLAVLLGSLSCQLTAQPVSAEWDPSWRPSPLFHRSALFPTYANRPEGATSANAVALSEDGKTAVYADKLGQGLGIVDLTDPQHPEPLGWMPLSGKPTAAVVLDGQKALLACDTGPTSGRLEVLDYRAKKLLYSFPLTGPPSGLALSPDRRQLAVAIENRSPEGLAEPRESLWIFTLAPEPAHWNQRLLTPPLDKRAGSREPWENEFLAWWAGQRAGPGKRAPKGGNQDLSLYFPRGEMAYSCADLAEQVAAVLGHSSGNWPQPRASEPEFVDSFWMDGRELLLVGDRRSHLAHLFEKRQGKPRYRQSLYTAPAPGSFAYSASRRLLVLGSERDDPKHDVRSYLTVYTADSEPDQHHIFSLGIPWGALSGLTAGARNQLFTVADKALAPNRIYRLDVAGEVPVLDSAVTLHLPDGSLTDFDLEGISFDPTGGFWLVAEGGKKRPSLLLKVSSEGLVLQNIEVPGRSKYGLEGVAVVKSKVYVAFQSGLEGDPPGTGRLGCYDPGNGNWRFVSYPLESGHFISGLSPAPGGNLAVLERDKKSRERSDYKRVFTVDVAEFVGAEVHKKPCLDLLEEYRKQGLPVVEKIEGLAFDGAHFWVVNDNDAMKSSYGETVLLKVESPRDPK